MDTYSIEPCRGQNSGKYSLEKGEKKNGVCVGVYAGGVCMLGGNERL